MYLFNKKAVSEVTSFVLITFIVIIASTSAYIFSKNLISDNIANIDNNNMVIYLNKISITTNEITSFDGSSLSFPITFKTGQLIFVNNSVYYQSQIIFTGSNYCINSICYLNNGGYERKYLNLSNSYKFSNNLTLNPGAYTLLFKNIKNVSQISVTFK